MQAMVSVSNLTRKFGDFTAVDDLSFNVAPGEVVGFLGPNGAGKSTTMKMVTGFLAPTSGAVQICGRSIESDALEAQKLIGYLPEGAPAYPDMTPREFLNFIADIRGLKGVERASAIGRAVAVTETVGVMEQPIDTLSKGFRRRVGLAQGWFGAGYFA